MKQAASQPSTWCLTAVDGTGRVVKPRPEPARSHQGHERVRRRAGPTLPIPRLHPRSDKLRYRPDPWATPHLQEQVDQLRPVDTDAEANARFDAMLDHAGLSGLADDVLSYTAHPWGFEPEDVQAKTLLLYGTADTQLKGAHARWWKSKLPNSRIEMMPCVGHQIVVPAWKRVLSHLAPGSIN